MYAFGFNDANGETPESGDVFLAVASAYAAAILIVVPIDNIAAAVLDAPVTAVDVKKTLGMSLLRGSAGDTVRDFNGLFAGLFSIENERQLGKLLWENTVSATKLNQHIRHGPSSAAIKYCGSQLTTLIYAQHRHNISNTFL